MTEALVAGSTSTFEAMGYVATRTLIIVQVLVFERAEVVTVVRAAFKVASRVTSLHDHLPLESLPSV